MIEKLVSDLIHFLVFFVFMLVLAQVDGGAGFEVVLKFLAKLDILLLSILRPGNPPSPGNELLSLRFGCSTFFSVAFCGTDD